MLLERLSQQLISENNISPQEADKLAKALLIKRGHLNNDGSYTQQGYERSLMTPQQRAVDRVIKKYGGDASDYKYEPDKNYAYKTYKKNKKNTFVKWFK